MAGARLAMINKTTIAAALDVPHPPQEPGLIILSLVRHIKLYEELFQSTQEEREDVQFGRVYDTECEEVCVSAFRDANLNRSIKMFRLKSITELGTASELSLFREK